MMDSFLVQQPMLVQDANSVTISTDAHDDGLFGKNGVVYGGFLVVGFLIGKYISESCGVYVCRSNRRHVKRVHK